MKKYKDWIRFYMKKLDTWIYKTSRQFRSKFGLGERPQGRLPTDGDSGTHQSEASAISKVWQNIKAYLHRLIQILTQFYRHYFPGSRQDQQVDEIPGWIENFNQKVLKIPPPYSRFLKPLIITISLVTVYAITGFYLIPAVLKAKIPGIIQEETGRKASVATIEFNPFKFIADIQGFKIEEKNGKPFVEFDRFNIDINGFQSILELALVIDDISLNKPVVHLAKQKDGKFNFEDMAKSKKKEEPKKTDDEKLFPVHIVKLAVKDGKLFWNDNHFSKPVSEEIAPINLNVSELSTEAEANKAKLEFNLGLKSGGKLDLNSSLGVNPVFSEGGIKLDKVQLKSLLALALSDTAAFDVQGHELLKADFKVGIEKQDLKVSIKKSRVELQNFQFTDKSDKKTLFKTPSFAVETDALITIAKNNLDVVIKKAQLIGREMQFSQQMPEPISISVPEFNHETDVKVSQAKEGLKVTANAARIAINNLLVTGLKEEKVEVKVPKLNLETAYQMGFNDKSSDVSVSKGKFEFHDLHLAEKGENSTLIKIPAFGLSDMNVDLKNREVKIALISSKDAEFEAWFNPDGTLNYQKLIATPEGKKVEVTQPDYATAKSVDFKEDVETAATATTAAVAPVLPEKKWLLNIAALELSNYMVNFEDKSLKKPAKMTAKPINLKVNNISNKPEAKLPFQLDVGFNKTGSVKLAGDTVLTPLTAKVDVDIKNIALKDFQPYVEKFAHLFLLDGKFNVDGGLAIKQIPDKPLDVKFIGNAGIASFLTRDKLQYKDLVRWKNLTLKNLDVDLLANRYAAANLTIEKPYAKVTIRKDKTINYSDLIVADKGTPVKSSKPPKAVKPAKEEKGKASPNTKPIFKLSEVKIVDGSSDFADLSLILPFAAQIESLDGGAKGISSDQKSTIKVDLKGSAYDLAPVDIAGEISPYLGNYDISLKFNGLPMPLVTPYMVQFAGYKIEKGKLTLGLRYQVENGKLNASNSILIDQLELGDKVENPDAVSLPLKLAISLLKDSSGKIKLDVPLTGSLEDPEFSMGGIIVDALVNVLTKIVASPFNAIASLVGSEENLSVVNFKAGKSELDDKEMKKLDDVAKALKEKPVLNLEIKGGAFIDQDWPVLSEDALQEQLKSMKAKEMSKEEGREVSLEQFRLSEDDYNDLLADAFIKRFPTLAEKSLFGTPKLLSPLTGDFYQVAREKMAEIIKPQPKRLENLASSRSQAIAKYLAQKAGISNDRIYILDSAIDPKRDGKEIVSQLSLKAN
jgi:outer membrane protein OmpA-like peptidoglycan-associated protein